MGYLLLLLSTHIFTMRLNAVQRMVSCYRNLVHLTTCLSVDQSNACTRCTVTKCNNCLSMYQHNAIQERNLSSFLTPTAVARGWARRPSCISLWSSCRPCKLNHVVAGEQHAQWKCQFRQLAESEEIICITICRQREKWPRGHLSNFLSGTMCTTCIKLLYLPQNLSMWLLY